MTKKQRRKLARAERDVKAALQPYTKKAALWQTLGKVDLSNFLQVPPKKA